MLKRTSKLLLAVLLAAMVGVGTSHAGGVITDGRVANDSNQQNEEDVETSDSVANALYLYASMIFYGHEAASLNERILAEVERMEECAADANCGEGSSDSDSGCQATAPLSPLLGLALLLKRKRRRQS